MAQKKKSPSKSERRKLRTQQIIFASIAIMIVIVMIISSLRF